MLDSTGDSGRFISAQSMRDLMTKIGVDPGAYKPLPGKVLRFRCPACGGGRTGIACLHVTIDRDGQGAAWRCTRTDCGGSRFIPGSGRLEGANLQPEERPEPGSGRTSEDQTWHDKWLSFTAASETEAQLLLRLSLAKAYGKADTWGLLLKQHMDLIRRERPHWLPVTEEDRAYVREQVRLRRLMASAPPPSGATVTTRPVKDEPMRRPGHVDEATLRELRARAGIVVPGAPE